MTTTTKEVSNRERKPLSPEFLNYVMSTLTTFKTVKVRKTWDFSPVSRVHGQGKGGRKAKYGKRDRRDWRKDAD